VTLQIFFIFNKCCSFQLYKNVFENKKYWFKKKCFQLLENGFQKCFLRPNQHIRMISEGSCKGWSKEA